MPRILLTTALGLLLLSGCQRESAPAAVQKPGPDAKALKVKVAAQGDITADGQPVTPEQLDTRLAELKQANGEVWYTRDNPQGQPHENSMKVVALVAKYKLPIRFFSDSEFTKPAKLR